MKHLREIPMTERRSLHNILTGLLVSVAGAEQFVDMVEVAGHLLAGHMISLHITPRDRREHYRLAELSIDYEYTGGLVRREVTVVLDLLASQPPTVMKHISATNAHEA